MTSQNTLFMLGLRNGMYFLKINDLYSLNLYQIRNLWWWSWSWSWSSPPHFPLHPHCCTRLLLPHHHHVQAKVPHPRTHFHYQSQSASGGIGKEHSTHSPRRGSHSAVQIC